MSRPKFPTLTLRVTHATWWSAIEISVRYGVQFAVMVVLARLLSPADFGVLAMVLVFTTFAALLVDGGLGSAIVRKQDPTADDETSVFLVNLGMGCALALALSALAPMIARFYMQPVLVPLLRLMAWVLPLGALAMVPNAVLSRRLEFRARAATELIASVGSALLALWLAWRGHGVWALAWQAVVWAGLRAAMLWLLSGWRPRGCFDWRAFAELFRFSGFLLLANALNIFSVRLQSLLIGRMFDPSSLGYFSMAQDTQQAPAQFMGILLNRVGLPMFSVVSDQPDKLAGALRLSLRLSMFVFAPLMFGLAVMAGPIVVVLYGREWEAMAPLLGILAVAAVFWPLHALNLVAISARGRSDLVLKLEIVKALVLIPMVLAAVRSGVMAVAWAVLASSLASVVTNTLYSRRLLSCSLGTQLRVTAPVILLAAGAAACGWLASRLAGGPVTALAAAVPVSTAVYAAGAVTFRLQAWRDFKSFLRAMRARSGVEDGQA